MARYLICLIILSTVYSIVPPKDGKLSSQIWERMKNQNIGELYGDPGWKKKISNQSINQLRNTQLEFFMPVLLGKYSDVSNTFFEANDFDNLLFDDNPTGSMSDYYNEISYGNFEINGTVNGWYQSSLTQAQAVDNVRQYVAEIASMADSDIDYGQYDNDGPDNIPNSGDDDGYVDGIAVVYPGCLSGNDNIWAHQSSLGSNQYVSNDQSPNGGNIIINSYMVCPELPGSGDCITTDICPMGIYAHEFGHVLGLPDLYDRDQSDGDSEGLGEWCLMASGSWLGWYGDTPSHMSSWCKMKLGWLEPSVSIASATNVPIAQLATSPSAIRIWEDDYRSSRYFLIENRQYYGFDSDLNGAGLLIYHVNENRTAGFDSFGPNNDDANDKLIDLEASDGEVDLDNNVNRGDAGDPFPGTSNNRTFNGDSNPSSNRNSGYFTGISVENISDPDSLMFTDISPMLNSGYTISYDEFGIAPTALSIGTEEQWAGVHFTTINEGYVTEIDFGLVWEVFWNTDQLNWEVNIYDSFDGVSPGNLYQTVSGTSFLGGWQTIEIDSFQVGSNQDFFIGIKFSNNGYVYAYDNIGEMSGRSYYSSNGVGYDNGLSLYGDANIRAKLSTESYVSLYEDTKTPYAFNLKPNFPNPFNPGTMISFAIGKSSKVKLDIFDIKGRNINTLVNELLPTGDYAYYWDASKYSSGVYFVRLMSDNYYDNQKIMLLK